MERSKNIALVIGVLIMGFAVSFVFAVWTEPSASPPDGNVSAPVNVSDIGQTKTGALTVQGDFTAPIFYDTVSAYYVNPSGSSNLSGNLTIGGYASSSQFCIGTDCLDSWAGTGNWTLSGSNLYPTETSYNVGIGTTSPSGKLEVRSILNLDGITISGPGGGSTQNFGLTIRDRESSEAIWRLMMQGTAGGTGPGDLYFMEGTSPRVTFEAGGNVGIGTTSPSAKLDVVGDFEVSGNSNTCHLVYFDIGGASCPDGYYTWDALAAAESGYMMCCKVDNPI